MALLTEKEQSLVGAVGSAGMTTHWAGEATVVGIDLNCHTALPEGFVANHALKLSKTPLGRGRVGFALLPARFLAALALGAFSNAG